MTGLSFLGWPPL